MPAAQQPMPKAGTTALYCAVQFGKTLLWVAADLVAFYVLGVVEHVPTGNVAMILTGSLAWHALSDALVGHWLERRSGSRRNLALITGTAVPFASVAFVLALLMAAHWPWAALAMMMACRTAYSLYDVPHLALIGRMARLGYPVVRIVGIRNLWGQLASLALGLSLLSTLGPVMTAGGLGFVLVGIATASAILSAPIALLVYRLWDQPSPAGKTASASLHRAGLAILAVLAVHLAATATVATAGKLALGTIAPGLALAMLSAGRILASVPLPARWRERHLDRQLVGSALILAAATVGLWTWPNAGSVLAFGLASGWINILTWAWLGQATDHPRTFGMATMLTKIGLMASIPAAAMLLR